jgi:hypothetical protein
MESKAATRLERSGHGHARPHHVRQKHGPEDQCVQAFMKLAESASKMGLPPFKHWEFPVKLAEDAHWPQTIPHQ